MNKHLDVPFKGVTFVALLLFAVGCASTSPTPSTSSPSLVGTWVLTVTEEDALVIAGQKSGMGQHEVTFTDNGRISGLMVGVGAMGEASYTLMQDKIVFTEENTSCVKAGFPTATYKWSVENDTLTFMVVDDACYFRRKTIDGRTLTRKTTVGTAVPTMPKLK